MNRLVLFALAFALTATGCASVHTTADLDAAAVDLDGQLDAPGLLAATALLYHASTERYPATPFELLGSVQARETGLQDLGLSDLAVAPEGNGVQLRYTLLPSAADPSDRFGTVTVAETDTAGVYTVGLLLERTADPDLNRRSLPLARRGQYEVVRAKGTLCAEVETIRDRVRADAEVGAPPLRAGEAYTVTFTATDGVTASGALREGVTVTLPR
ncbi:MAG: hypothetical protein AAGI91_16830 [Bacteroidota bacterium]